MIKSNIQSTTNASKMNTSVVNTSTQAVDNATKGVNKLPNDASNSGDPLIAAMNKVKEGEAETQHKQEGFSDEGSTDIISYIQTLPGFKMSSKEGDLEHKGYSEKEISDVESRLDIKFNEDYRKILLTFGGVIFDGIELFGLNQIEKSTENIRQLIKEFEYGIPTTNASTGETTNMKDSDTWIPSEWFEGFYVFSENGFGDSLCQNSSGEIRFLLHEGEGEEAWKLDGDSLKDWLRKILKVDKVKIEQVIMSSPNLFVALENVGSMYSIPAHNIINDDSLNKIKIVGDTITAPALPVSPNNMKAVMQAIGTVLDYISQRIDQKVDTKHHSDIENQQTKDINDPSLGVIIRQDVDEDGEPITVYDSGVITHANTPSSTRKVIQIREELGLKYPEENYQKEPEYFTDEDDITKDTDMDKIQSNVPDDDVDSKITDIASEIQEESFHLDHISRFHDTRHLGYHLLQEQGFDYIKRTDSIGFIQEEFKEDHKKPKKKRNKKQLTSSDIKYLKFDNKRLIQGIKYFNAAYKEQGVVDDKNFVIKNFMNSKNFQKGLDCIDAQFNCRTHVRFFSFKDEPNYRTIQTSIWNDLKNNVTISKAKGFQLNGLPIQIQIVNESMTDYSASGKSPEFFGQTFMAILLHEIFHNIAAVWRSENGEFKTALASTIHIASELTSTRDKRILFSNLVETLSRFKGMKLNKLQKQVMVKQMIATSVLIRNEKQLKQLESKIANTKPDENANKDLKSLIDIYKKYADRESKFRKKHERFGFFKAIIFAPFTLGISYFIWKTITEEMEAYKNAKKFEEFYCDLFAGMYNLPVVFFINSINGKRKYSANEFDEALLKEFREVEAECNKLSMSIYPSSLERVHASVRIAKNMLESKTKLHPDIKKYLQWIVDNFSSLENLNIDEIYNNVTFDPKTANKLDEHLQTLIDNNKVVLTEFFVTPL